MNNECRSLKSRKENSYVNLKSKVLISSSLLQLIGIGWSTRRLFEKTPQVSSKPTINLTISNYSELNRSDNQNIQVLANVDKKQATSAFDKAAGRRGHRHPGSKIKQRKSDDSFGKE